VVLTLFSLLIPAFALVVRPRVLAVTLQPTLQRSPTDVLLHHMASVRRLSPVEFSAPHHSTSELLRTLSRVAASKPTS